MVVGSLLTIVLAVITFQRRKETSLSSLLATIADTPYRYCYASTLSRFFSVGVVYCLIFFTFIWGSAYLLSHILWVVFKPSTLSPENWRTASLPILVFAVYGMCWLPGLSAVTLDFHRAIMRHLFFPILPSTKEEHAIRHLLKVTEDIPDDETSCLDLSQSNWQNMPTDIQRQVHSMLKLYNKLALLLNDPNNQLRSVMFGDEWALINGLYQAISTEFNKQNRELPPEVLNTIQLCQYYCCHLLVRYWFTSTLNDRERRENLEQFAVNA